MDGVQKNSSSSKGFQIQQKKEISADLNFARKLTSTIVVDSDRY